MLTIMEAASGRPMDVRSRVERLLRKHPDGMNIGTVINKVRGPKRSEVVETLSIMEKDGTLVAEQVIPKRGSSTLRLKLADKGTTA